MTGLPVRDTKFAKWIDPDAWMERMTGPKWSSVLKEEHELVKSHTDKPEVKKRIAAHTEFYKNYKTLPVIFNSNNLVIEHVSNFFRKWCFENNTTTHESRDVIEHNDCAYSTVDIKDGQEYFELQKWSPNNKKPDFKFSPVGPDIAIHNDTLYYLGVRNKLQYHELWKCDLSGKNRTCIYREKSPEVNLALHRLDDGRVLFSTENSQDFSYYSLPGLKKTSKYPDNADWSWKSQNLKITKSHGKKTLYKGSKKLLEIDAGQIVVNPYAVHSGLDTTNIYVVTPIEVSEYNYTPNSFKRVQSIKDDLIMKRITGRSADGTQVHGILTYSKKPKHLFAIGYGAYGMESNTTPVNARWGPLVKNDWAILYTFIRGGGDHDEAWAKAGRVDGRHKTIQDFEALVRSAQVVLNLGPKDTVIYGRSAGGLLMGGCLKDHPEGSLMCGVYAEVPYVDELRTTTNPDLPLTTLEHREFGNPTQRLEDFISVALLSPADTACFLKTPDIFVLTRTAEFDSQVFAYEPVKWIRRLRNGGGHKLCIIESGQGHFTPPDITGKQWATDLALIQSMVLR
jgi:protease II